MRLSFFKYIFVALLIAFSGIIYFLDHDEAFCIYVEQQIKKVFLHSFKSILQAKVKRVRLLTGEIELEHVTVSPPDNHQQWQWKADTFILQFSWLSFLLYKKFDVTVILENLDSHSQYDQSNIAIIDHLQCFIAGAAGFPATLKMLTITKGHFVLYDPADHIRYETYFHGMYGNLQGWYRVNVTYDQGSLYYNKQEIFHNFSGAVHISIPDLKNYKSTISLSGKFITPLLASSHNQCHVEGQWHIDAGQLIFHTLDNRCAFTLYNWKKTAEMITGDVAWNIAFDDLYSMIPFLKKLQLNGSGTGQAHVEIGDDYTVQSSVSIPDLQCYGTQGAVQLVTQRTDGIWTVDADYIKNCDEIVHGSLIYHEKAGKVVASLCNKTDVKVSDNWVIDQEDCCIDVTITPSLSRGTYRIIGMNTQTKVPLVLGGTIAGVDQRYTITGSCNAKNYEIEYCQEPQPIISKFLLYDDDVTKPCISLQSKQCLSEIEGTIDFGLLQELMNKFYGQKITGEGRLSFEGSLHDATVILSMNLLDGTIRIPGTYTLIRDLQGCVACDLLNKKLVFSDLIISLDKGSLSCQRAVVHLNDAGDPIFVYMPCIIKKAFLTVQKELFAVFSGALLVSRTKKYGDVLKGKLVLDRGYCKKNIFAQFGGTTDGLSSSVPFEHDCLIDLLLETKKPVEVKTSFLETQIQAALKVQGSLKNPEISGSLVLEKGTLSFPYRPLTITHGTIYFLPHQLYDPAIELIAKGKLRKYQITLRCNGSLKNPHISFESSPPLTEEQIITLLLAGSEEGSLSLAMPAFIMQKLQNVIFGPEQPASKLEGYFKSLLSPLKHIRFIPGFSDQSGRGGFRGSIEIDVNDQLRGIIQKNFSLSEDIKLEVEYYLSDDITVRGMRDERGDYGGEVEMRWRF